MLKKEGFFLFVIDLFKFNICFTSVRVAIKQEDLYVGAIDMSLDGIETWLDLILKLIKMKTDDYIITGVKKILLNEIEVKVSNQIPSKSIGSIIAVCVLNELGIFFFKKNFLYNFLYFF
jgi:hypothetical protein